MIAIVLIQKTLINCRGNIDQTNCAPNQRRVEVGYQFYVVSHTIRVQSAHCALIVWDTVHVQ